MKNKKFKIWFLGGLMLLTQFGEANHIAASMVNFGGAISFVGVARAQSGDISGSGNAVFCRNGSRDYTNFLSSVIGYDGFVEYWKDILVRYNANQCLYLDIDNLLQRIDKTRQQIRNAFYSCDSSAPKLAKTYYQLDSELYFLRKYVDVSNGLISFGSQQSMNADFLNYVVSQKNYFTMADGQTLFQNLYNKYSARQSTYTNCSDPTWGNIVQKWNDFRSNLGGFSAVQDAAESISKQWDNAVNTPFKRTGDLLGGLLDVKINNLDPATGWGDIAAALNANAPTTGAKVSQASGQTAAASGNYGFSFNQFLQATTADTDLHDQEKLRTQYLAQYQQTYQQGSSDISKEIIDRVNYLDTSINLTYPFISATASCTKGIVDKTCQ